MSDDLKVMYMPKRIKALGFVKSRKSHDKIQAMCHGISGFSLSMGINIQDYIVDESAGIDIDRSAIDKLMNRLEQEGYKCVVVLSIFDITKDMDDLEQFLLHLEHLDCQLYSIGEERFISFEMTEEE